MTFPDEKIVEILQLIKKNDFLRGKNLLNPCLLNPCIENDDLATCTELLRNGAHIPDNSNGKTLYVFLFFLF